MKGNIRMYSNTRDGAHNYVAELMHDAYYYSHVADELSDLCDAAKLGSVQRAVITLRAVRRDTLAACGLSVGYCSREISLIQREAITALVAARQAEIDKRKQEIAEVLKRLACLPV